MIREFHAGYTAVADGKSLLVKFLEIFATKA